MLTGSCFVFIFHLFISLELYDYNQSTRSPSSSNILQENFDLPSSPDIPPSNFDIMIYIWVCMFMPESPSMNKFMDYGATLFATRTKIDNLRITTPSNSSQNWQRYTMFILPQNHNLITKRICSLIFLGSLRFSSLLLVKQLKSDKRHTPEQ